MDTLSLAAESRSDPSSSDSLSPFGLNSDEPRQYFRIHSMAGAKKLSRLGSQTARRRPAKSSADNLDESNHQKVVAKPKISNAALKKLLNQSLLKAAGSSGAFPANSSSLGKPGSSFKFVFIQRATASPRQSGSSESVSKPSSADAGDTSSQSSLAASISKQLASSLISSAAGLVGNLSSNSAPPSLSSLADKLASFKGSSSSIGSTSTRENDLQVSAASNNEDVKSGLKKARRPSKIYNLPVKFVSNGQPNHVVINTIKQHFATIKKIHQSTAGQKLIPTGATGISGGALGKRKKPNQKTHKVGTNSRLIYLPIRYLSNARPNKIMIAGTKAAHKSSN